ncbi:MAG: conjugal transfer protein TraF [bacterium]
MRKAISLAVAVSMVAFLGQIGLASSFKILGTRPLGMGGAFVAVAEDSIAQYWNPAGFALQKGLDIQIPLGVSMETTEGLIKEVDDLGDIADTVGEIQEMQKGGAPFDSELIQEFTSAINEMDDLNKSGLGLILDINAGFNIRYRNLGMGVINITELGTDPDLDLVHIGLGGVDTAALDALCVDVDLDGTPGDGTGGTNLWDLTSSQQSIANSIGNSLDDLGVAPTDPSWDNQKIAEELVIAGALMGLSDDEIATVASTIAEVAGNAVLGTITGSGFSGNETNIRFNGIMLFEAPVTYARELPWLKNLYVGGNIKFMYGIVGFAQFDVFSEEDLTESLYKDYRDYSKTSTTIGADIGALYDLRESWGARFGMVVRNLTYPSFSQPKEAKEAGLDKYVIEPQVRIGAAYWPLNFITLSADLDVTNNKTVLPGYHSRMLSLGAEVNLLNRPWLNLALRGGFMDNLSESYGSMFTAGLGLNLFHFQLDFAGAVSTERTSIAGGQKFPTALIGSLGLSFNF